MKKLISVLLAAFMLCGAAGMTAGAARASAPQADKSALNAAIDAFEAKNEADYTAASWAAAKEAYDDAVDVQGDRRATKQQISDAAAALNSAIAALVLKPVATDKTALEKAIANAGKYSEKRYTAKSWAALQSALAIAVATADDASATQAQVNAALAALNAAVKGLERFSYSFAQLSYHGVSRFWSWILYYCLFGWLWMPR
ncbi:MAG: FIVAR domain-containing protein [Oscillospiraceae bacterium]|jgi:endo-alpha-N-acetylgalactosaminidase|nr:FIVAR domain-containing protein [Oscillospiraceae bacterium]